MAFVLTNVQNALIADPVTQVTRAYFSLLDQISVEFDYSQDLGYGGSTTLPIISIPKDAKPVVNLSGIEFDLQAFPNLTGGTSKKAITGTPIQQRHIEQRTIGSDGKLNKPLTYAISATNLNVNVITALDFQPFTAVASTATQGQFVTPVAGATTLQFNTSDAGKIINLDYWFDNTGGSQFGYNGTSTPKMQSFLGIGTIVNTLDPNQAPFPGSIAIPKCKFTDKLTLDSSRNKITANKMSLTIFDPGGAQDAVTVTTLQPFM